MVAEVKNILTPAIERVMRRVTVSPGPLDTDCWICSLSLARGYAIVGVLRTEEPRTWMHIGAHRVTYAYYVGAVPDGLQLDHLCRVRNCVNPAHLEAVTPGENMRRGMAPVAIAHRTNICKYGHSLEDAWYNGRTGRRCQTCHREDERRRYWARKAAS